MASAYQVGAAVLAHVARRGQWDSALDERSLSALFHFFIQFQTSGSGREAKFSQDLVQRILKTKIYEYILTFVILYIICKISSRYIISFDACYYNTK